MKHPAIKNMYKCNNCGNNEKFYGTAEEKGNALIYQDSEAIDTWIYNISDKSWQSKISNIKCFYCGSDNVRDI